MTWSGTFAGGAGELHTGGEGGEARPLPMDWAGRSEQADGTTSPEELLAASAAGCYAMQLALLLQRDGVEADELQVRGTCELDEVDRPGEEYAITRIVLEVDADASGVDDDTLRKLAEEADRQCPVANALRGSVEVETRITVSGG